MPLDPVDYVRASALVTHAALIKTIERSYPTLTIHEQDAMMIDIIDRMARMRGWAIRRECSMEEVEGE